jgi:hypothetical protein
MVRKNDRHHCFGHRNATNSNAWIMAAFRFDIDIIAMDIDCFPRR